MYSKSKRSLLYKLGLKQTGLIRIKLNLSNAGRKDWIFPYALVKLLPFRKKTGQQRELRKQTLKRTAPLFLLLWLMIFCLFVYYFLSCTFLYSPFDNITICFSKLVKYIYFYQRYLIFLFLLQPRSTIF